jgi:hypothetical protein
MEVRKKIDYNNKDLAGPTTTKAKELYPADLDDNKLVWVCIRWPVYLSV